VRFEVACWLQFKKESPYSKAEKVFGDITENPVNIKEIFLSHAGQGAPIRSEDDGSGAMIAYDKSLKLIPAIEGLKAGQDRLYEEYFKQISSHEIYSQHHITGPSNHTNLSIQDFVSSSSHLSLGSFSLDDSQLYMDEKLGKRLSSIQERTDSEGTSFDCIGGAALEPEQESKTHLSQHQFQSECNHQFDPKPHSSYNHSQIQMIDMEGEDVEVAPLCDDASWQSISGELSTKLMKTKTKQRKTNKTPNNRIKFDCVLSTSERSVTPRSNSKVATKMEIAFSGKITITSTENRKKKSKSHRTNQKLVPRKLYDTKEKIGSDNEAPTKPNDEIISQKTVIDQSDSLVIACGTTQSVKPKEDLGQRQHPSVMTRSDTPHTKFKCFPYRPLPSRHETIYEHSTNLSLSMSIADKRQFCNGFESLGKADQVFEQLLKQTIKLGHVFSSNSNENSCKDRYEVLESSDNWSNDDAELQSFPQ